MDDETYCRVWWDDDADVARAQWRKGATCGIDEARVLDGRVGALGHGKVPTLVDMRNIASIDRAAREYFSHGGVNYSAVALLAESAATRMMANFFLGLQRGDHEMKMFTAEADALVWLQARR